MSFKNVYCSLSLPIFIRITFSDVIKALLISRCILWSCLIHQDMKEKQIGNYFKNHVWYPFINWCIFKVRTYFWIDLQIQMELLTHFQLSWRMSLFVVNHCNAKLRNHNITFIGFMRVLKKFNTYFNFERLKKKSFIWLKSYFLWFDCVVGNLTVSP